MTAARVPVIEVFRGKDRKCRTRIRAGNGEPWHVSQAYSTKSNAIRSARRLSHLSGFAWKDKTL